LSVALALISGTQYLWRARAANKIAATLTPVP